MKIMDEVVYIFKTIIFPLSLGSIDLIFWYLNQLTLIGVLKRFGLAIIYENENAACYLEKTLNQSKLKEQMSWKCIKI